ncbi:MAG: DDE-type integrase/transposase/recombinase [Deltaproteobacteria bacterium]|nr:DDE-type integrase/transposase/recombinase [Deltaproteobacteria bacterium]
MVKQFKSGRGATSIARIQKISRQMVYKLVSGHRLFGDQVFQTKRPGRPRSRINSEFAAKVVEVRKSTDYGSEKLHFVKQKEGFSVSQRQVQRILDERGLTDPCVKRRGQRKYVRFQWPISNYMWHTDWSGLDGKWYCVFIDDRSRKIMAAGEFSEATTKNTMFLFYQAVLSNGVCPVIMLSDKGSQFFANTPTKNGERALSQFETELDEIGVDLWTSRRNHPQTNGKMEKWFDTMKKRRKKHPDETLQEFVKWYNEERIHHALGYKTPQEVYGEKL